MEVEREEELLTNTLSRKLDRERRDKEELGARLLITQVQVRFVHDTRERMRTEGVPALFLLSIHLQNADFFVVGFLRTYTRCES